MPKLPTLTSAPTCLTTVKEVYNRMLMYFYVTSAKQSSLYGSNVASLRMILNNYETIGDVSDQVERRLTDLLLTQFSDVFVTCTYETGDSKMYKLIISTSLTSGNTQYSFRDVEEVNILTDNYG